MIDTRTQFGRAGGQEQALLAADEEVMLLEGEALAGGD